MGKQQLRLTKGQRLTMRLQQAEHRYAELAQKIERLRRMAAPADDNDDAAGSGSGSASAGSRQEESGEAEQEEDKEESHREANIIGNAAEVEAEMEEQNDSGPNQASPFVRMQAQDPNPGLSSAVNAARLRQANARQGRVSDFSAANNGFQNMNL